MKLSKEDRAAFTAWNEWMATAEDETDLYVVDLASKLPPDRWDRRMFSSWAKAFVAGAAWQRKELKKRRAALKRGAT